MSDQVPGRRVDVPMTQDHNTLSAVFGTRSRAWFGVPAGVVCAIVQATAGCVFTESDAL